MSSAVGSPLAEARDQTRSAHLRAGALDLPLAARDGRDRLGDRLRSLRVDLRLTQQELADLAGVSKQAIHTYERGRKYPHRSTLGLLAAALGVEVASIAGA